MKRLLRRLLSLSPLTAFDPLSSPLSAAVTSLSWIQASLPTDDDDIFRSSSSSSAHPSFKDDDQEDSASSSTSSSTLSSSGSSLLGDDAAAKFLQKLPSLAKNQGNLATKKEAPPDNVEDGKKIKDQKHLNVLTVGFGKNMVRIVTCYCRETKQARPGNDASGLCLYVY